MLFHTPTFVVFFLAFLAVFLLVPRRTRSALTLAASFAFYAWWKPADTLLLAFFPAGAFLASFYAVRAPRAVFALIIAAICAPLLYFKYWQFLWDNLAPLQALVPTRPVKGALPLGVSFLTFTVLAYLIDLRRGVYRIRESLSRLALYISFFPHLIAGPIMRPKELFPQFAHFSVRPGFFKAGLLLFSVGVLKKTLVADSLSHFVDGVYTSTGGLSALESALAFYGFAIQIYCDFSGYVDMALGIALILGVRLPLNFNRPYTAVSIRDFWRKWHMTLSRWLRDYIYIPLGGSRRGPLATHVNLIATMLIGGLWHGAAWTFVFWGGYHGLLLAIERAGGRTLDRVPVWVRTIVTFHLVAIGWVFFRSPDLAQVSRVFAGFGSWRSPGADVWSGAAFPIVLILLFLALHRFDRVSRVLNAAKKYPAVAVYAASAALLVVGFAVSVGNPNAFIYFDF